MNIEKTISEHAVSDILTPMLESQDRIVTEDVAPLFNKATGLDTPPASGTVTTTIEESRSVITAIIRKAWTAPLTMLFGASVIGYITAAYTYLRTRLQGNETYGIPDRRSEISASSPLAANLALLNDRKISGVPDAVDGMSLVQILCASAAANEVLELTDNTHGWNYNKGNLGTLLSLFPNATKITFGCKKATQSLYNGSTINRNIEFDFTDLDELQDNLVYIGGPYRQGITGGIIHLRALKSCNLTAGTNPPFRVSKIYFYVFERGVYRIGNSGDNMGSDFSTYFYIGCMGNKSDLIRFWSGWTDNAVQDVEIRNGACQSITLQNLNGLTAENMYNHILCRLKQDEPNCGSGVTITLGTTNIEKLEAVEEYNTKLTELEDTYGYTFA